MQKKFYTSAGKSIGTWLAQLVILILCVSYINFFYFKKILPDKQIAENFRVTNCTVVDKYLTHRGRILHRFRADFLLSYYADGVQYQAETSGNGLDRSYSTDQYVQEDILNQFMTGQSYPCWFNPAAPVYVVLVLRHNWSSTLPLVIPSIIALIMLFYVLKSLFVFCGWSSYQIQHKRQLK